MIKVVLIILIGTTFAVGQTYIQDSKRESARSDKLTNGIKKAAFIPGDPNIRLTLNIPSFQLTVWQSGKEVAMYHVGVGQIDFPVPVSLRNATSIEFNPVWIPPSSDWIEKSSTVKAGEVVLPTDPRNPLGKIKIPLGYGYLLHQAKGPQDLGNLVSHGCIRVMQNDLYEIAEMIAAARSLDITASQIAATKRNKKTVLVPLETPVIVEITYDTIVVENGRLNVYPDVYAKKMNTIENVRTELRTSGIDDSLVTDKEITRIISLTKGRQKYFALVGDLEAGKATSRGRYALVLGS
ncbi:MAG TPA: L,D-transpeptidase [Pyrinomonadaceae bacterium]|nr:L,D-transpeptidase [Pyrinomonadaceae bacterium]